jgi:malate dehydrogenase (oxaloacetate-decarboxylating)
VLIGTSGQPGAFTREAVTAMAGHVDRPVILPLSNPTASCEADPRDVVAWTDGQALVATGSPFPDVEWAVRRRRIGQGNNAFVFPGVGLAVLAGEFRGVPDLAFTVAARALAAAVTDTELESGLLYPPITRLRAVSQAVGLAVLSALAADAGRPIEPEAAASCIRELTWEPEYVGYEPE